MPGPQLPSSKSIRADPVALTRDTSKPGPREYAGAVLAAAAAAGLRWALDPWLGSQLPFALFLIAAAFVASWSGLGPALLTVGLGAACSVVFFSSLRAGATVQTEPLSPLVSLAVYVVIGVIIVWVCASARELRRRLVHWHADSLRLEKTTAHLAAIVTSSDDAIISKDLDGVITSWNRSAQRMFGYDAEEAIGKSITMLIPPDHLEEEPGILARIRRGETIDHYETIRRRKDGTLIDISITVSPLRNTAGEIVGASKIARDVTERKKAAQSVAMYAAIVESSEDAIISKNLDGVITSWNRSAERMFGYDAHEAVGRSITMLIPPDHIDEEPTILGRIRRGESLRHYETVRRRKDGTLLDISLTVSPIRDGKGAIVGASKIVRDVTAAKRVEAALKKSEQQARNALVEAENAARSKDEFLALLSHELRTPMSAIVGWARLLRAGLSPEEMSQGIEVIERNARLQAQIIEDLLDMSRIVSGKFRLDVQTVNVGSLVSAAVDAVRLAAEAKDLHLTCVCDPRAGEIRGDPARLQQVFFNLLTNATKFTPRGGIVQVTCQRAGSSVEITVSDTGMGIKPEFLPHVFERFRQQDGQTTRVHQGLGLGLAIVKHLVELHGGSVRAASAGDGKGATFTVLLPVSVAITPYVSSDWSSRRDHPSSERWLDQLDANVDTTALSGITVLVTDDEADARELLRKMLEQRGATVLVCGSAHDTLDRVQRHRPDVLVCDIGMPGIDGYGLISRLRSLSPERGGATPAIALTAFARSEDRTRSLLAGFQMHLSKPVEPEELVASIRSVAMVA